MHVSLHHAKSFPCFNPLFSPFLTRNSVPFRDQMALAGKRNNRKRGSRSGASLGRSRSFREGSDSWSLMSGRGNYRGNFSLCGNLLPMRQCLMLDPITIGAQKYSTSDDLRRVLRIPLGRSTEDSSSGAALANHPNTVAIEELKLYKSSVQDAYVEARSRVKKMEQSLSKLNKYCEALSSKEQQRIELPKNERLDGCLLKTESQIHRDTAEPASQRREGVTKTVAVSKRVCSTVTKLGAEIQDITLIKQSLIMCKDRDVLRNNINHSLLVDENIHGLPAGEEWEEKRGKRHPVSSRLSNGDTEVKSKRNHRVTAEHGLPSTDALILRSTSSEDISTANQIGLVKGNDLSALQSSSMVTSSSPSNVPHASGTLEVWESMRENFKSTLPKSVRNPRLGCNMNGSEIGCPPLKKLPDQNALTYLRPSRIGKADDDHEEILAAADFAVKANHLACPSIILKKIESPFSCVKIKNMFYLDQQGDMCNENTRSQIHDCEEREGMLHHKHGLKDSCATGSSIVQFQDLHHGKMKVFPLYQRVLAALIVEDEDTFDNEGRNIPSRYSGHMYWSSLPVCGMFNNTDTSDYGCRFMQDNRKLVQSRALISSCVENASRLHLPRKNSFENVSAYSGEENYVDKHMEEGRLYIELLNIGLYQESLPDLTDREDEPIDGAIAKLQHELSQQVSKKVRLAKTISESIAMGRRELEQLAMDRLVVIAHKKLMATQVNIASKSRSEKVSKDIAVAFMRRTLARCKIFEKTGKSCFSESPYSDILFAPHICEQFSGCSMLPETPNSMKKPALPGSFCGTAVHRDNQTDDDMGPHISTQATEETGPTLNRGRNEEALVDDINCKASMDVASSLNNSLLNATQGKRSKRGRTTRDKSSVSKNEQQQSAGNSRGKRKTRAKKKPRTAQLSSSGNGLINKSTEPPKVCVDASTAVQTDAIPDVTDKKDEVGFPYAADTSFENLLKNNGSANISLSIDLDGLNEDNLPEDDHVGLDIPMDDLSTVFG